MTTASRADALPNLPTVGEFVPGFEARTWQGFGAPKGTPAAIVDELNQAVNAGLGRRDASRRGSPTWWHADRRFAGRFPESSSPPKLRKWAKVIHVRQHQGGVSLVWRRIFASNETAAEDMAATLKHVRTPTLDIAYEESGHADGLPIFLLHGWPYDPRCYDEVVPPLAAAGCRVVVPYLRGFGPDAVSVRRHAALRSAGGAR